MDFYVIIVPILLLSVFTLAHLLVLARRDNSFFAELRRQREAMIQIRENNFSLTQVEYRQLRASLLGIEPRLDPAEKAQPISRLAFP